MTKDVISKKSIQVKCCSDEDLIIVFVLEKHFRIMLTSVRLLTGICESNFQCLSVCSFTGCALRIMLFGESSAKKTALCNFIVKKTGFDMSRFSHTKQVVQGEWKGQPVTVVKTPDLFGKSLKAMNEEMRSCVSLCPPGPNVLLLLVKPSEFTEENRKTLRVHPEFVW